MLQRTRPDGAVCTPIVRFVTILSLCLLLLGSAFSSQGKLGHRQSSPSSSNVTSDQAFLSFGVLPVATTTPNTQTVTFTVPSGLTLGGVAVVTQGQPNLDFTAVSGGTTCAAGVSGVCAVQVQFVPLAAGIRQGAVTLSDSSGNPLISVPLSGVGNGPTVAFGPGTMTTVVGGNSNTVGLSYPNGVAVDAAGNIYVSSSYVSVIYKVTPAGVASRFAGTGRNGYSGDGGPATSAELYYPGFLRVDGAGNVYITDDGNNLVRMVTPEGIISTVAGLVPGAQICAQATDQWGDGCPATQASLDFLDSYYGEGGAVPDVQGNLYIADTAHNLIRKVDANGIITAVAGTGAAGYSGDNGPALQAQLNNPDIGGFDSAGNLYIADLYNNVIRKLTPDGIITTVAGTGAYGHSGDGGPATSATLGFPYSVQVDAAGDLYITDSGNFTEGDQHSAIRKVTPAGIISIVAGQNASGNLDGYPATSALMWGPVDIAVDGHGNLFISDDYNHEIRKVNVSDPPALSFTSTTYGSTSTAQDVDLLNLGNVPLNINPITTAANFSLGGSNTTCGSTSQVLAPAADCVFSIEFAPMTVGSISGSVQLTDNATPAIQAIPLSGAGLAATPAFAATCLEVPYDGTAHTCTGSATGITGGAVNGSWSFNPASEISAGSYSVVGTFASSDPDYLSGGASATLVIDTINQLPTVSCPAPLAYDGAAHACTITGGFGVCTSSTVTNVPGGAISLSCTGDVNHNPWSATGAITIIPANQTPVVNCHSPLTYDGAAHSCTITAGVGTCTSGSEVNVPGGSVALSCTGDSNHNPWSSTGSIVVNKAAGVISCPGTLTYQLAPAPFCSTNSGAPITFNVVRGAASITPNTNGADLSLSTNTGTVTILSASAPATANYTAAAVITPLVFTTVPIPVHLMGCKFTLTSTSTGTATTSTYSDMPPAAKYGDTVTISGCTTDDPNQPVIGYTFASTSHKSTMASQVVTFRATENVAILIYTMKSLGYAASSWTSATTIVGPRPLTVQSNSPVWPYGSLVAPTNQNPTLSLAPGTAPLVFADRLPTTGGYTITDASGNDVTSTPRNQMSIGSYTLTPIAGKLQVNGLLPYYSITGISGTLTVAPVLGNVKPNSLIAVISGIHIGSTGTAIITVTNKSGEVLNIAASLPTGPYSVSAAPGCSATAGNGGTCALTISFKPTVVGAAGTVTMNITATDANNDQFNNRARYPFTVSPVTVEGFGLK
jgi:hypothetical protein